MENFLRDPYSIRDSSFSVVSKKKGKKIGSKETAYQSGFFRIRLLISLKP